MKILGIDPSLTATGWYILDTENPATQLNGKQITFSNDKCGEIKSEKRGTERLLEIEERIEKQSLKIDLVVMERYVYFPRYGSSIGNIELGAILKRLFYVEGIPLVLVAPPTLKKFITGSGKSKKNEILKRAYQKWNIDLGEHKTEAFALSKIGEMVLKKDDKQYMDSLKIYEKEALKTILKGNDIE